MVANDRLAQQDPADELSALVDGELSPEQAERALARLLDDPAAQARWLAYHTQADALRFPTPAALDDQAFLARFGERFSSEPVHLPVPARASRPVRSTRQWRRAWLRYGMPGAAAAAAIATVTWMTYPHLLDRGAMTADTLTASNTADRAAAAAPAMSQDFLLAHQQYAPSSRLHGVAPYVRTASAVTVSTNRTGTRP